MDSIYNELKDIHYWHKYYPLDDKYYKYSANIIFACCKISDLYYQLCNARMSLHFYCDYEKYSMMSENEVSILSTKKYFIENALLYYNFSVDYLWQVLWLYYDNSGNKNKLPTNELYQKLMKECNLESLLCGLTEIQEVKIVEMLRNRFSPKNAVYSKIREYYNYLKHRATFHTSNLGINDAESCIPIITGATIENNQSYLISYKLPLITRKLIEPEELKELLVEFDKEFVELCEYFFDLIVPKEYMESNEVKMQQVIDYNISHLDELKEYAKKYPAIVSKTPCQMMITKIDED